jgi:hypothetical protein
VCPAVADTVGPAQRGPHYDKTDEKDAVLIARLTGLVTSITGPARVGRGCDSRRGAQRANPVYGAGYRHLTGRGHNKLTPTQAQTAIAAAILRHLHAVICTCQAWDPVVATDGTRQRQAPVAA